MYFDHENDTGHFEPEPQGALERSALVLPPELESIGLRELKSQLALRRRELVHESYDGNPDYQARQIVEIIDAHLRAERPDLYHDHL